MPSGKGLTGMVQMQFPANWHDDKLGQIGYLENMADVDFCLKIHHVPQNEVMVQKTHGLYCHSHIYAPMSF